MWWTYVVSDLDYEGIVEKIYEKWLQKYFKKSFCKEKRENTINNMLNGKATAALLIVGLIRMT